MRIKAVKMMWNYTLKLNDDDDDDHHNNNNDNDNNDKHD